MTSCFIERIQHLLIFNCLLNISGSNLSQWVNKFFSSWTQYFCILNLHCCHQNITKSLMGLLLIRFCKINEQILLQILSILKNMNFLSILCCSGIYTFKHKLVRLCQAGSDKRVWGEEGPKNEKFPLFWKHTDVAQKQTGRGTDAELVWKRGAAPQSPKDHTYDATQPPGTDLRARFWSVPPSCAVLACPPRLPGCPYASQGSRGVPCRSPRHCRGVPRQRPPPSPVR